MPFSGITNNKIFQGVAVAAIIGSWVWIVNLSAQVDSTDTRVDKEFAVWEQKLDRIIEDVEEIKQDVKEINASRLALRDYPPGLTPDERRIMDQVADAVRRQNCFLAGGKGPACQNIQ